MKSDLVDLELVDDSETVAAICAELNSMGQVLVCYGCGDVEALIVGFLVLDHKEQAWALCGKCRRRLPFDGALE